MTGRLDGCPLRETTCPSPPTIDAKRRALYVGTGDAYSEPASKSTDAIVALDLDSGRVRLDIGRTLRLTASALEVPQLTSLANQGKVKVQPYKRK